MEFPGGKIEPGETLNECIVRELKEELNADVLPMDTIYEAQAVLPGKTIELYFIRCILLNKSELKSCDGQDFRWVKTSELDQVDFLPADIAFARLLAQYAK